MEIETTIVGAGIIGLAIAAELSGQSRNIYVIESGTTFGATSNRRQSEVLHAGVSYPPGSLKARLCTQGNRLLRHLCQVSGIRLRMCGKLFVAANAEETCRLESLARFGQENGIEGLDILSGPVCQKKEPQLRASAALFVPTAGIVDSRQLIRHFVARAGMNGVTFVYQTRIQRVVRKEPGRYVVHVAYPDGQTERFFTRRLINAAGLDADQIAAGMGLDIDRRGHRQYPWKGTYYTGQRTPGPLNHLIYPVPAPRAEDPNAGAWNDLEGRFIIGPKAVFVPRRAPDDDGDPVTMDDCFDAIQRCLPHLRGLDFVPEAAGVWPKLHKPGDLDRDFVIQEESAEGFPGVVNLIGIESPGLTSCMAIAAYVKQLLP